MASIFQSRKQAAELIRHSYPPDQQGPALAALGDAATAADAADLFAQRCKADCLRDLSGRVGAPLAIHEDGVELAVQTSRGELRLFRGTDSWYGLVFQVQELARERDRAAAELDIIRKNAAFFRAQSTLQTRRP